MACWRLYTVARSIDVDRVDRGVVDPEKTSDR